MDIGYLVEHREHLETVTGWLYREWGSWYPKYNNEKEYVERISLRLNKRTIPCIFVAFDGNEALGTSSLLGYDMEDHRHYTPWLASVYVKPEARRQGVGSALVRRAEREALEIGVRRLYLFTPDMQAFYAALGWKTVEQVLYRGDAVDIMARELGER